MAVINTPELPSLIVNRSGSNRYYVYTYKNKWDKETKRATRGKGDTTCVGKYIPDPEREGYGEILFHEEFKNRYPELEHLRVFRFKGGKLEFKAIEEENAVHKSKETAVMHGGATWALNEIVGNSMLGKVLKDVFPEYNTALKLLSLAYYLVIRSDAAMTNYEEFAECTWLPYQKALVSSSISRTLKGITQAKVEKFFTKLQQAYEQKQGQEIQEHRFWALDSTSVTSYSEEISSVAYGHNKDLIQAPQTNVLMIVDQSNGQPVYCRHFDGNVPDVSTIRNTLADFANMKFDTSNVVLVTDRGYGSIKNYDDMLRSNISFINNVKLNAKFVTDTIDAHYKELIDWNNFNAYLNQNAVTVPVEWKYDGFLVDGRRQQKKDMKQVYMHLYFNSEICNAAITNLQGRLAAALKVFSTNPSNLTDYETKLINTYTVEEDGKRKISMSKVDQTLRYAGVRVLISDVVKDAQECHIAYEERNQVEYAFNTMKSRLNCNRTKVHSDDAWLGKLFLQMLATSISGMVRSRVKDYNDTAKASKGKYRVHWDSDGKLLNRLNNIYVKLIDGGWMFNEIAGERAELFSILGVPVPGTQSFAQTQQFEDDEPPELAYLEEIQRERDQARDL